jgi:hypothetical protein
MICSESATFHPAPFVGSNLPLYTEVGQVHGSLGSLIYGLRVRMDLGVVMEPEKPWALFGCSIMTR